jgi:hypothetical protein
MVRSSKRRRKPVPLPETIELEVDSHFLINVDGFLSIRPDRDREWLHECRNHVFRGRALKVSCHNVNDSGTRENVEIITDEVKVFVLMNEIYVINDDQVVWKHDLVRGKDDFGIMITT